MSDEISKKATKKRRPTIDELERILNSDDSQDVRILPNGEIRAYKRRRKKLKPLTMKNDLGGEYGIAP